MNRRLPLLPAVCLLLGVATAHAQTVQPTIMEYGAKAEGKFAVTNNTTDPMTVVIEPRSFSIAPDGRGTFRALDPGIQVELSTMSVRLQPLQTYWVFYKATAETYPAWFTIYSTFTPSRRSAALNVRFQLPHTVYLYQKTALTEANIAVTDVTYSIAKRKLLCDLENTSASLGRVLDVQLSASKGSPVMLAGFPLLPGMHRHIELPWDNDALPTNLRIRFEHFTLKPPVAYAAGSSEIAPTPPGD